MKLAIIIILLLILALALTILYFDKKLLTSKQQYVSLTKQYKNLREKYLKEYKSSNNIFVKYSTPTTSSAITNANVSIYLAPLESCPIINTLDDKIQVTILDQAETNTEIWYYISIPTNTNINSKGWIKKCDFSLIFNQSSDLANRTR